MNTDKNNPCFFRVHLCLSVANNVFARTRRDHSHSTTSGVQRLGCVSPLRLVTVLDALSKYASARDPVRARLDNGRIYFGRVTVPGPRTHPKECLTDPGGNRPLHLPEAASVAILEPFASFRGPARPSMRRQRRSVGVGQHLAGESSPLNSAPVARYAAPMPPAPVMP
jgi:hypothetical protein